MEVATGGRISPFASNHRFPQQWGRICTSGTVITLFFFIFTKYEYFFFPTNIIFTKYECFLNDEAVILSEYE